MLWVSLIVLLLVDACLLVPMVWHFATTRAPGWVWGILGLVLFFGGLANFFTFWHLSLMHGGSPSEGKVEDGRFYVMSHGRLTEVEEATWQQLRVHERSVWITHPLAFLGLLLVIRAAKAAVQHAQMPNPSLQPTGPTTVASEKSGSLSRPGC